MSSTLEPPSDAPRRGLSRLRKKGKDDSDKNSSTSSLAPSPDETAVGLRASIDGAIGKLKDRRRKSTDADRSGSTDSTSTTNRLSRLSLGRRSRKSSPVKDDDSYQTKTELKPERGVSPNPSELSLGLEGSGHSSLMTEDSDNDE